MGVFKNSISLKVSVYMQAENVPLLHFVMATLLSFTKPN